MRIAFFGKGGSGKTTLATSFIKFLVDAKKPTLAIDADINVNLHHTLNLPVFHLGDHFDDVAKFLEPTRSLTLPIIGSTPPASNSYFIKSNLSDPFFSKFATKNPANPNLSLLTVGTYSDQAIGYECYHSKLGVIFLIYNRLLDDHDLHVVADATAGIDSVGTSMFCMSDLNIFVVEPTQKSINVYLDFLNVTKAYQPHTMVLVNKIQDQNDIDFVKSQIDEHFIIDFVKTTKTLRAYEQGNTEALLDFVKQNRSVNQNILNALQKTKRNWNYYYQINKEIHINECKEWYNDFYRQDLPSFIDPNFNYQNTLN